MLNRHLLEELAPLKLNLARLKCLALLLAGLLRHRTVNLAVLATENLSGSANESVEKFSVEKSCPFSESGADSSAEVFYTHRIASQQFAIF